MRGRHAKSRSRRHVAAPLAAALLAAGPLVGSVLLTQPASAAESVGNRMLDKAESRTGDWYSYGGTGPSSFDCSGLVYWAAGAAGRTNWPRDTYDIAALIGKRFVITSHPQRGDLALWGSVSAPYHVEFVTKWWETTFGAQNTGTRVGWHYHYPGWRPDFYLRILY